LTTEEKGWLERELRKDGEQAHLGHSTGILTALLSSKVWMIGLFFFFVGTCGYGFSLSAPDILQKATGWTISQVGWLIALLGLAGAVAMLLTGASSDRRHERAWHCIVPCLVAAAGYVTASYSTQPWVVVISLSASFIAFNALWGPALSVPMEFLAGRAAAAGIAAMNTIAIFSGFLGPYWMGVMKDHTGTYQAGLRGLMVSAVIAAAIMVALMRSLAKRPAAAGAVESFAEESA
jgi:ACS family tartrate transporter-like MFS transporter